MRKLTLTFPVLEYFPPYSDGSGKTVTFGLMERPRRFIWKPMDDPHWVTGILDSGGNDVPVIRVTGSYERAFWTKPLGWVGACPYIIKFHYGASRQLTIEEFRGKLINLVIKQRGFIRHMNQMHDATTYRGIMLACFGGEQHFKIRNPPLTMDIEVSDAAND